MENCMCGAPRLPIACSNRSAMPEWLGDGGMYFDPENPQHIARALQELTDSPELRTENARFSIEVAEAYSWARCAKETFGFVAGVTANSKMGNCSPLFFNANLYEML